MSNGAGMMACCPLSSRKSSGRKRRDPKTKGIRRKKNRTAYGVLQEFKARIMLERKKLAEEAPESIFVMAVQLEKVRERHLEKMVGRQTNAHDNGRLYFHFDACRVTAGAKVRRWPAPP